MAYKLGSLFDGSGGFPLAGALCGVEPCWASEVEPYPIAVTRSRFPSMKHLGDISKINGAEVEPVDIITFGSPCQDLSVAGKRAGLKHEANGDEETTRSGLFMEAVRIIKEMKEATNGQYPTFALWENVPGAFSSNKGEDFRVVLEELIKIVEPRAVMPAVPKRGWAYADSYIGDRWSLAYRTFDAQYWGVPQRRRRIHLVLDLRGERAREVLFEREGVRGYFTQGRTPWQGIASGTEDGTGANDTERTADASRGLDAVTLEPGIASREGGHVYEGVCGTLRANAGDNQMAVAYTMKERAGCAGGGKGPLVQTDQSATLQTSNDQYLFQPVGTGGSNVPLVMEPKAEQVYCLQGNGIDRADTAGCNGKGWKEDISYTLNTVDRPAVSYWDGGQVAGTLTANNAGGNQRMPDKENFNCVIDNSSQQYIVRRITPTECARLQGFADRWGDTLEKSELTPEEYEFWLEVRNTHAAINGKQVKDYTEKQMLAWYNKLHTDGAEYKMWGNGIALPPALYCMQGMTEVLEKDDVSWLL